MDIKNLSIIRQTYANTVFTHKVLEIAAENNEHQIRNIKFINIFLVAIVLILLILQSTYPDNLLYSHIGAGVTVAEVIFLIVQLSFAHEQQMVMCKNSALKFMQLRDKYRLLITDVMNERKPVEEILSRRDLLQSEYQVICDLSPQTGMKEYEEAQNRLNKKGIVKKEQFTWSDDEIDRFLPESLRLNKK